MRMRRRFNMDSVTSTDEFSAEEDLFNKIVSKDIGYLNWYNKTLWCLVTRINYAYSQKTKTFDFPYFHLSQLNRTCESTISIR